MKTFVLFLTLSAPLAFSAHAQGVVWHNQFPADGVVWHVYSPDVSNPSEEFQGNVGAPYSIDVRNGDLPTGSTVYTGTLIGGTSGGSGAAGWQNGDNYSIALYGAVGANVPASHLQLVPNSTTTFMTSDPRLAGFFNPVNLDPVVPGATYGGTVTVQARAWYSGAGQYSTYGAAVAAGAPSGFGAPVNVVMSPEPTSPDPAAPLQSFSLTVPLTSPVSTPEPSAIVLALFGASAFFLRRAKKI